MTSGRSLLAWVTAFAVIGGACVDQSSRSATKTGGTNGQGGSTGGNTGDAGSTGDGGYAMGNPAVPSEGCGKPQDPSLTSGASNTITSSGTQRIFVIDIPTGYDMNKPYPLFFTFHVMNGSVADLKNNNYYGLKTSATSAGKPSIFLAPQALPGNPGGVWNTKENTDQILFEELLALAKKGLCVDLSRVFSIGFSFGGMMTYSLSVKYTKDLRAGVGIAPANYNIYLPTKTHQPFAWMQTTGMGDSTCPWVQGNSTTNGAKYIAIEHATENGCTVPATIPTWQSGAHVCYDFQGCKTGYPTKACTFNGGHTDYNSDSGGTNWIYEESWKFFSQF